MSWPPPPPPNASANAQRPMQGNPLSRPPPPPPQRRQQQSNGFSTPPPPPPPPPPSPAAGTSTGYYSSVPPAPIHQPNVARPGVPTPPSAPQAPPRPAAAAAAPPMRQVGVPPPPPLPPPRLSPAGAYGINQNQMNGYGYNPPSAAYSVASPGYEQQQYQQQPNLSSYPPPPAALQHSQVRPPPPPVAYQPHTQPQYPPQQIPGPPPPAPQPGGAAIGLRPPPPPAGPQQQQPPYQPHTLQQNSNTGVFVSAVPPLFTRPQALDGVDQSLDVYYPKAMVTSPNVDPNNAALPPPADSRYIVVDDGNASPDFIRCTLSTIPTDRNVLRQATGSSGGAGDSSTTSVKILSACMGAICTPMALPSSDHPDDIFPVEYNGQDSSSQLVPLPSSGRLGQVQVDYTTNRESPPRCSRCNAYVNPFWSIRKCNFCGSSNRNVGTHQHASNLGTVEYPVQGPYITRRHRPIVESKHAPNAKKQPSASSVSSSTALSSTLGLPNPVQPNWVIAIDLSTPQFMSDVDFILDVLWPMFYERIVQHHSSHNAKNGKTTVPSRVSMVFVAASGVFLPPKHNAANPNRAIPLQFTVMPDVQLEPFCPLPLEDWSWSLPDEYDTMMDVWKNTIRPTLLPRLVKEHCRELKVPSVAPGASTATTGGYALSAGGTAIAFLLDALRHTGGRGVYWSWRRPNYGVGALPDRERNATGESGNLSLYTPLQNSAKTLSQSGKSTESSDSAPITAKPDTAEFYNMLGRDFSESKVALDVIIHTNPTVPQSFVDIATLSRICDASCGRFLWMVRSDTDENTWRSSVAQELLRPWYLSGWDAILKVRCSNGLSVKSIVSSVGKLSAPSSLGGNPDELELGVVTPETCIGVTLDHRVGGIPKDDDHASLQTALLYTNPWTGERRVRVSTLTLRISTSPELVAKTINFNALAALQLRLSLPHSNYMPSSASSVLSLDGLGTSDGHPNSRGDGSSPDQRGDTILVDARYGLVEACCQILIAYRKLISKSRPLSAAEFLVPPNLDLLPLFVMSSLKSPLLRPSLPRRGTGTRSSVPSPRGDERAYYFYHARRISPSAALHLVHPLLFGIGGSACTIDGAYEWHNTREGGTNSGDAMASLKSCPVVKMPRPLQATVSNLEEQGIYLLDTCFNLYVVVEEDAVVEDTIQTKITNAASQLQIWSQVGREERSLRPLASLPIVTIMKSNDPAEYQALLRWMVLDATSHEKDFNSFIFDLSKRIQQTT